MHRFQTDPWKRRVAAGFCSNRAFNQCSWLNETSQLRFCTVGTKTCSPAALSRLSWTPLLWCIPECPVLLCPNRVVQVSVWMSHIQTVFGPVGAICSVVTFKCIYTTKGHGAIWWKIIKRRHTLKRKYKDIRWIDVLNFPDCEATSLCYVEV